MQRHAKTAKAGTRRGRSGVRAVLLASIVTGLAGAAAAAYLLSEGLFGPDDAALPRLSYAELTGSVFLPAPADPFRAPAVRELQTAGDSRRHERLGCDRARRARADLGRRFDAVLPPTICQAT